jgi:RHS repeat-associated protein
MNIRLRNVVCLIALSWATSSLCQVATGTYPFGTFENKGFETINVGNLNVHFEIPVLNKTGRGLSFYYNLAYDSSVWYPTSVSGSNVWTPVQSFGWKGDTEIATGYLSYSTVVYESRTCVYTVYTDWVYHDPFGVSHQFFGSTSRDNNPTDCGADYSSGTLSAEDGSSLILDLTSYTTGTVSYPNGEQLAVPNANNGSATAIDSNGNEISVNGGGGFTDTTGNQVLTVAGSAPNPETFTYKDTNGNSQTVTMNYQAYTVKTDFGCSGIGEYGPTQVYLVSSITLADDESTYSFNYEPTPNSSGDVTGRIASITLPSGGTISYSYSGGDNGIECADGSAAGLTRSIAANSGSQASSYSYQRSTGTNTSQTTEVDGFNNTSVFNFVQASNQIQSGDTTATTTAVYYETARTVYQGGTSDPQLLSRQVCYNAEAQPCTTEAFTVPFTQIDTYDTFNGTEERGATYKYNSNQMQTDKYTYDFGASSRGALLEHEVWTYGGSLTGLVTEDQTYDGSGNLVAQSTYSYDTTTLTTSSGVPQHIAAPGPRGNQTVENYYYNASNAISVTKSFEDTGSLLSSAGPNGTMNWGYDSTFVYNTSVTPPTPSSGVALPTSQGFDSSYTGLQTNWTDPNTEETVFKYSDPLLRLTETDDPDGGKTMYYYSPTQLLVYGYQSSSTYSDLEIQIDGYGRSSRGALNNGQSTNPWYQQDICYDQDGRMSFQSYRYQGLGWPTSKVCSGSGDSYSYDALGRVTQITHADGTSIGYTYSGRATETVDENGVTRIVQVDGLKRPTAVCEISSNSSMPGSGSPAACNLDISGTGFLTAYTYSLVNHEATVTQGAQSRVFQTDWIGRLVSIQEPESGQTTFSYSYNSTGLQVTRQRPKANQTNPSNLTTTTAQYDLLGRILSLTYNDGTPTKTLQYDANPGWSVSPTNLKGRLALASSGSGSTATGDLFSYDAMGRVLQTWECAPWTCGTSNQTARAIWYNYDWEGDVTLEGDAASGSIAYGRSIAGEVTSITNQSYSLTGTGTANLVSSVVNGPFGPISWQLANGLSVVNAYDSLGRRSNSWVCSGSSQSNCSGGTQIYGFAIGWGGSRVNWGCDTVVNRCSNFGYDSFNRLSSSTVTSGSNVQNFTYVDDRWGNRWQQNVTSGSGPQPQLSFNTATNQVTSSGYSYDAAGNLTDDTAHSYTYDAEGNITAVDSGSTGSYVYDALNHRVHAQGSGWSFESIFDTASRITSNWTSATFADEGHIFSDNGQIAFRSGNGNTYFKHRDWVNTDRVQTDPSGGVGATFSSLSYGDGGNVTVNETYAGWDFGRFGDMDNNSESSTYHALFRQYSDAQGRWMSPDPFSGSYDFTNPQSFNRYTYTLNNPFSSIDPSGLDDICYSSTDTDGNPVLNCYSTNGGGGDTGSADCSSNYTVCVSGNDGDNGCGTDGILCSGGPGYNPSTGGGGGGGGTGARGQAPNNGQTWSETWQAAKSCAASSFGLSTAAAGGAVASGLPVVSTAGKFAGMTAGTSVASQFFRSILPQSIGSTWAPTISDPLAASGTLGGVVGRWVPVIGEAVLVYQGAKFVSCYWASDDNY